MWTFLSEDAFLQDSIYKLATTALAMDDQNELNHQVLGEYYYWVKNDPLFDNIKDEPRFRAVVKRCDIWADSMDTVVELGISKGLFPGAELLDRVY